LRIIGRGKVSVNSILGPTVKFFSFKLHFSNFSGCLPHINCWDTVGFPNIRWYSVEGDFNVMVLDILGPSLEDLFNYCSREFSLKTVLMLFDRLMGV